MALSGSVQHIHLQGVYSLLDDLQAGFVLIDPHGQIVHTSYWLRRLLPRQAIRGSGLNLLGDALYSELCEPVIAGRSKGERWREAELQGRDEGVSIQVSVRSTQVEFEDRRYGILLSLHDVSSEVGLHKQNKALLEKQKEINANLRLEIAKHLREHEDDISQLNEILQIAPTIFASFIAEAGHAIQLAERLMETGPDEDNLVETLRELHTLKGNARSLGLNFIGGRAHGVEGLLVQVREERDGEKRIKLLADLPDLLEDLRRAKNRASFVRSRLGDSTSEPVVDVMQHKRLGEAHTALRAALLALPPDSPARAELARATELLLASSRVELQELFEFLKAAVSKVSQSLATDCPIVDTTGGKLRVEPEVYAALSAALPHIVRNAVSHGIESAEERLELGKAAVGLIRIDARQDESELCISVADDGCGLHVGRLRAIAAEQGLPVPATPRELAALLFRPGVSTAESVDQDRGRGMGSSAAHEAICDLGGAITVETAPGEGTTFIVSVPATPGA